MTNGSFSWPTMRGKLHRQQFSRAAPERKTLHSISRSSKRHDRSLIPSETSSFKFFRNTAGSSRLNSMIGMLKTCRHLADEFRGKFPDPSLELRLYF